MPSITAATDPRTTSAVYVVEATSAEHTALWTEWSEEAFAKGWGTPRNRRVSWAGDSAGYTVSIGTIGDHPILMDIVYATIAGRPVLFWCPVSRVVDFDLCEQWLRAHVPAFAKRHTDADNFHHALAYLESRHDHCHHPH